MTVMPSEACWRESVSDRSVGRVIDRVIDLVIDRVIE